jgi:hypothetical protein
MIRIKIDTVPTILVKYILMASERKLSRTSTSFENRFKILPNGVVSKKVLQLPKN